MAPFAYNGLPPNHPYLQDYARLVLKNITGLQQQENMQQAVDDPNNNHVQAGGGGVKSSQTPSPPQQQVWPPTQSLPVSFFYKNQPGGQINDPLVEERQSLSFLPATPSITLSDP